MRREYPSSAVRSTEDRLLDHQRADHMTDNTTGRESLDVLYQRFDGIARGRARGDGRRAFDDIRERLAANRVIAESRGWTRCALERLGGTGQLRLWGVPLARSDREIVPDWGYAQG